MTMEVLIDTLVFQFLQGLLAQQYHETSFKIHIQKLLKKEAPLLSMLLLNMPNFVNLTLP